MADWSESVTTNENGVARDFRERHISNRNHLLPSVPRGDTPEQMQLQSLSRKQIEALACAALWLWQEERDGRVLEALQTNPPTEKNFRPVELRILLRIRMSVFFSTVTDALRNDTNRDVEAEAV